MRLGGDMGPTIGATMNITASAANGWKLDSTSHTCQSQNCILPYRSNSSPGYFSADVLLAFYLYDLLVQGYLRKYYTDIP
ncbi:hypothetical protein E2C01_025692 [Portunus trituberculatus]|uniref:Uncharacterized protein n=1 Tax=Portunus trituberculatus TaxID=210409 RepID=A0A5B7EE11_PORTR|nr:hypothetical protein [Portunus trituberculatus]